MRRWREDDEQEPLGVLLLPSRLEDFELAAQARDLLAIPRVVALEPPRARIGSRWADILAARQARRLRFPGAPRVLILYDPAQYPLARALGARYVEAELWYLRRDSDADWGEASLADFDRLAAERAVRTCMVSPAIDSREQNLVLRERMVELEVISTRPFVPGARIGGR